VANQTGQPACSSFFEKYFGDFLSGVDKLKPKALVRKQQLTIRKLNSLKQVVNQSWLFLGSPQLWLCTSPSDEGIFGNHLAKIMGVQGLPNKVDFCGNLLTSINLLALI